MSLVARALKVGAFDDFWASPPESSLGITRSGLEVSERSALNISTFWRCLNLLGGTFGATPLVLYRKRETQGRDRATDRPEYRLFRLEPYPKQSAFRYRQVAMNHLLTYGNHYAEQVFDGFGQLRQLVGLRPDRMLVRWADDGSRVYLYRQRNGVQVKLPEAKVFHVPGLGFDGLVGYAPLTLMRETVGSYMASRDFGAAFFKNGARPAIVMTHPKTMTQAAIDRLAGQMDKLRGSGNAGKTVLLEEGADFKELGVTPEDAQYMASQEFYAGAFCTWMGVPPHMAGLVDKSTSWGSGIEEQTLGFITYTMLSWFTSWEQETAVQLLPAGDDSLYAEFLLEHMLRGKALERAQAYQIHRNMGSINANEIRDRENMNPREDDGGDEFLLPMNMESVGSTGDGAGPSQLRTIAVADPRTRRNGTSHVPVEVPGRG